MIASVQKSDKCKESNEKVSKENKGDNIILGGTKNEMASWLSQLGLDSNYIGVDRRVSYTKKQLTYIINFTLTSWVYIAFLWFTSCFFARNLLKA